MKYSEKQKLAAVEAYMEGSHGLRGTAASVGVGFDVLRQWVAAYREHGKLGLQERKQHKRYAPEFKLEVLNRVRDEGLSYRQAAAIYDIRRSDMIGTWERAYAAELSLLEPGADSDADGFTDEEERQMGTHPLDATSRLQVVEWRPDAAGQFVLGSFSSIPGRSYRLLVSDDLTAWTDHGVIRAADWPASETPFELDPGEAVPGKLFIKVATLAD